MDSRTLLCGHCGPRTATLSCTGCGLPLCPECRIDGRCPACARALTARRRRRWRRALWLTVGLGSGLALPALCGVALVAVRARPTCCRQGVSPEAGRRHLENLEIAIRHDTLERGTCPDSLQALPARGLLRARPLDPWGTPPDYRCAGESEVRLTSAGPDRVFHTADDLQLAIDLDPPTREAAAPPRRADDPVPVAATAPVAAPVSARAASPPPPIEQLGDGRFLVRRSGLIDELARDPLDHRVSRIVPLRRGERWAGVRLVGLAPQSLYRRLGLQSGDVVLRVNGAALDSPRRALALYAGAHAARHVDLQISRRGRRLTLRYWLVDG